MNDYFRACLAVAALFLVFFWLSGCTHAEIAKKERMPAGIRERGLWVDSVLEHLTLEEKIGQMIMARAYGYYYSAESDENKRLEHLVRDRKFGGFVFFQGDVYETAAKINHLQELSDQPLLIASDMEWGAPMRIRRGTRFPEAMALGAARDTMLAFEVGKAIGEEARSMGIMQDYAPDADINVNPDNPVINTRSFGEQAGLVADMAGAFAAGLDSGGILATAKHFPGHGDTKTDSHLELPLISSSRDRMDTVELVPFRRVIGRGIPSIMIAHLLVPALESHGLPSTLSPAIVTGLLEGTMGYHGLVVTDAMEMGAIVNKFGADESAIKAIEAGVDMTILLQDEDHAAGAIASAVRSGRIPAARIDRSVRKILEMKWDLGLVRSRLVDLDSIPHHVQTPEHLQLAKRAARCAITIVQNKNLLPLERFGQRKIGVVIVADVPNYRTEINRPGNPAPNEQAGDYFIAQLRKRCSISEIVTLDPTINRIDIVNAIKRLGKCEDVICAIYSKARSGSGKFGLDPVLLHFLDTLAQLNKPVAAAAMGSPYVLKAVPDASAMLCAYSDAEGMNEATVEALFGEIPAGGRLPVTIPGIAPYGTGVGMAQSILRTDHPEAEGFRREGLASIDTLMAASIADSVFPGAQVLIAKNGGIVYNKSFGRLEYEPTSQPVTTETMYDLASLTKVVATTSAVMRLYDEGRCSLDDPVVKYLPQFGNHGKENIRLRNLMLHNAGLPPFKRLYLTCTTPQQVLDSVFQTETVYPPGDSTVYSDFDFIVLGKVIETIAGVPLNRYVDSVFFHPLRMDRTMYLPPSDLIGNIAPTEYDSIYRKQLVHGVVHDENAYALGGVSGHAGLFSTASDLAVMMQLLMNGGTYGGRQYLKPETIALFTSRQSSGSSRALGWDTKSMDGPSTAGSLFSARSFGHTGFTGTSIWADPTRNLFVIFLTNRIYPSRTNPHQDTVFDRFKAPGRTYPVKKYNGISQVRPALHDAVIRALEDDHVGQGR